MVLAYTNTSSFDVYGGNTQHARLSLECLLARIAETDEGHGDRVGRMAVCFGALIAAPFDAQTLSLAGRLHDAGKLLLPDRLVHFEGRFSAEQREAMQLHAALGSTVLHPLRCILPHGVMEAIASHHERYDGAGYPQGLAGTVIPWIARMIGLLDVVDALLCTRSYKKAWAPHAVKTFLNQEAGVSFDPDLARLAYHHFAALMAARCDDMAEPHRVAQIAQRVVQVTPERCVSTRTLLPIRS
ncbi:response regulator [Neokomagataea tanensis NBRC 106556]|uniref:Response regulator n=1 Tax=Neokomagataea tanensis NBRC 106556 TaxID=1223519 RepID=A0ABQ0QKP9_9PROT|nr:response regulator [Neokomagataea tanensis NBRC 106556]